LVYTSYLSACLTTPLRNGRRQHTARGVEANLDEAREEVLVGERADLATYAEGGRCVARGLGDDQLDLAEGAAARHEGSAVILKEARARGVHGGQVARTKIRPRGRRKLLRRVVDGVDLARQIADRDVELIVKGRDAVVAAVSTYRCHLYISRIEKKYANAFKNCRMGRVFNDPTWPGV